MPVPRVLVLRAPGTNCDAETAYAFERTGGQADRVHLFRLIESPSLLEDYQILVFAGGFSYGDDVGAGVIFGQQLRSHLVDALKKFVEAEKLVLGICNGFQILMRSGLLPGGIEEWPAEEDDPPVATLTWNSHGRYVDRWVRVAVSTDHCPFLRGMTTLDLPIAHAEGRIAVRNKAALAHWRFCGQIALQYVAPDQKMSSDLELLPEPINPNGSTANIAGLCDPTGRILGLMPHPERFQDAIQHPSWTRHGDGSGTGAGLQLFQNAVSYFG